MSRTHTPNGLVPPYITKHLYFYKSRLSVYHKNGRQRSVFARGALCSFQARRWEATVVIFNERTFLVFLYSESTAWEFISVDVKLLIAISPLRLSRIYLSLLSSSITSSDEDNIAFKWIFQK